VPDYRAATATHEGELKAARDYVRAMGGSAWKMHQRGRIKGDKGVMDMFFVIGARWGWYDAKVKKDKPTPEQVDFAERVQSAGGIAVFGLWDALEEALTNEP
jgi:hypothetical protein